MASMASIVKCGICLRLGGEGRARVRMRAGYYPLRAGYYPLRAGYCPLRAGYYPP